MDDAAAGSSSLVLLPLTTSGSPSPSELLAKTSEEQAAMDEPVGLDTLLVRPRPHKTSSAAPLDSVGILPSSSPILPSHPPGLESCRSPTTAILASARPPPSPANARHMVVEAGDVARILPLTGTSCGLCSAVIPGKQTPCEQSPQVDSSTALLGGGSSLGVADERFFIDGRLACGSCRDFFEPAGFKARYLVCVNPLCRRKWKQLAAKVMPLFCPPCRRQLEEGIPGGRQLSEWMLLDSIYHRWRIIAAELIEVLGYDKVHLVQEPAGVESDRSARSHWCDVLEAFQRLFPQPPHIDDVRNWNSVHGRRKHYRGLVRRRNRRVLCDIEAYEETNEDLKTLRKMPADGRSFHFLDWNDELFEEDDVDFIAFPNPAVTERNYVSRIVRMLGSPRRIRNEGLDRASSLSVVTEADEPPPSPIRATTVPQTDGGFADLMQWCDDGEEKQHSAADVETATTGCMDRTDVARSTASTEFSPKRLSLEAALPYASPWCTPADVHSGGCGSFEGAPVRAGAASGKWYGGQTREEEDDEVAQRTGKGKPYKAQNAQRPGKGLGKQPQVASGCKDQEVNSASEVQQLQQQQQAQRVHLQQMQAQPPTSVFAVGAVPENEAVTLPVPTLNRPPRPRGKAKAKPMPLQSPLLAAAGTRSPATFGAFPQSPFAAYFGD